MSYQYTIGDFLASGYKVYDVSHTFQPGGFLWHFVEIAHTRPAECYIQPYDSELQSIVPIYQASYLIMNEAAVAWLENTISDYMPPVFNPVMDMNTAIQTPDDFTLIGGNEAQSFFNSSIGLHPFNFGFKWDNNPTRTIIIIVLFVFGVTFLKKKRKKRS